MSASHLAARAPRQERSAQTWARVLHVAMAIFAERGWEGFTITEVCRRVEVSPTSIYARTDGKVGLFRAAHEAWLEEMADGEAELRRELAARFGDGDETALLRAAWAIAEMHDRNAAVLRAVIGRAIVDDTLRARGAEVSRALVARLADSVPGDPGRARDAVAGFYAQAVLRTAVGADFLTSGSESLDDFVARMMRSLPAERG